MTGEAGKRAKRKTVSKEDAEPAAAAAPILVRAAITLPDLAVGSRAWVNPSIHYIQVCLENGYLVPVDK